VVEENGSFNHLLRDILTKRFILKKAIKLDKAQGYLAISLRCFISNKVINAVQI
jgi:hypothetical protein